jgi:2,3,4,5-tetrahydropyridine-2-carboxylate N-succinyltransferase
MTNDKCNTPGCGCLEDVCNTEECSCLEDDLKDPYKIAAYIKNAVKTTPVKAYVDGNLEGVEFENLQIYGNDNFWIIIGEYNQFTKLLEYHKQKIRKFHIDCDRRNSAIPLLDIKNTNARIEPGAFIRDKCSIGKGAVIMMGAVINIGADIGDGSMVDMNAVIGARGVIGKNVHVGAGSVIAGVLEPPSSTPVIIEDNVLIGANAVILEGVRVGKGAVVAAGSVVTRDVEPGVVVAGTPAKFIKRIDQTTRDKTKILEDLRG